MRCYLEIASPADLADIEPQLTRRSVLATPHNRNRRARVGNNFAGK
jgi:hypothetical protein